MPYLFGERIRLRAVEKEDITSFLHWVNDEDVTENLFLFSPMSRFEEEKWYESMMKKPTSEHVLVIEVIDQSPQVDYRPIGTCQFQNLDWRSRSAEIGIMIGEKSFWDRGYGTETMRLLLRHGFNTLNLHRIWLQVYAKNKRGIRAYEKAGFVYEGKYRQAHYQEGEYHDIHLMSVLKEEWQTREETNSDPSEG
ncbi:MAG: GNAT family N-acetyltransferase [Brevefilum sp.]